MSVKKHITTYGSDEVDLAFSVYEDDGGNREFLMKIGAAFVILPFNLFEDFEAMLHIMKERFNEQ